jgi:hypothetical protein
MGHPDLPKRKFKLLSYFKKQVGAPGLRFCLPVYGMTATAAPELPEDKLSGKSAAKIARTAQMTLFTVGVFRASVKG